MSNLSSGFWILRLAFLLFAGICAGQQPAPAAPASSPSDSQQVPATQSQTPAAQSVAPAEEEGPAPLRVMVSKSLLINTTDKLKRVSVTDPEHAGMVAAAYAKNVIDVLTFGPVGAQEVLLEVKFAEVDRSAVTQLGLNVFSTGAANTTGTSTTGQFGGFQTSSGSTGGTFGAGNQ